MNKAITNAAALLMQGNTHGALAALDDYIVAQPEDAAAYELRASVHSHEGNFAAALEDCQQAMALGYPLDAGFFFLTGTCHLELRQFAQAYEEFSKVLESAHERSRSHFESAALLLRAVAGVHNGQHDAAQLRVEELGDDVQQQALGKLWNKQALLAEMGKQQ